ncbi:MAG: LamG domain-containing protein [Verrucomicrobiota bacterium]
MVQPSRTPWVEPTASCWQRRDAWLWPGQPAGCNCPNTDPSTIAGYVDLPNFLISPLVNVSYEAWATWQGSGNWQRIFDFGVSNGGEGNLNERRHASTPNPWRFAVRDIPLNGEPVQLNTGGSMPSGSEFYMAVTYNFTENVSRLYTNGVLAATASASVQLSTINDVNNWLGRSQWGDPIYQGLINEFRIYEEC